MKQRKTKNRYFGAGASILRTVEEVYRGEIASGSVLRVQTGSDDAFSAVKAR